MVLYVSAHGFSTAWHDTGWDGLTHFLLGGFFLPDLIRFDDEIDLCISGQGDVQYDMTFDQIKYFPTESFPHCSFGKTDFVIDDEYLL